MPPKPAKLEALQALELTELEPADAYVVAHQLAGLRRGLKACGL